MPSDTTTKNNPRVSRTSHSQPSAYSPSNNNQVLLCAGIFKVASQPFKNNPGATRTSPSQPYSYSPSITTSIPANRRSQGAMRPFSITFSWTMAWSLFEYKQAFKRHPQWPLTKCTHSNLATTWTFVSEIQ